MASGPDVASPPAASVRDEILAILSSRRIRRAAKSLAKLDVAPRSSEMLPKLAQSAQHQGKVFPSAEANQYVPASVQDVEEHMLRAAGATHLADDGGRMLPESVRQVVRWIAGFGRRSDAAGELARSREWRASVVAKEARRLRRDTELVRSRAPAHVKRMVQYKHWARVAALLSAVGMPDVDLAVDMACGMPCIGDVPPSGNWEPKVDVAEMDIARLDHEAWHRRLFASIEAEAAEGRSVAEIAAVAEATRAEVAKGLMHGPVTADELDNAYGRGRWRAMRRFAVEQRGKVRPCDNAKTSLHNACCTTFEKVACETADFPARVAGAFADEFGVPVPMQSGTE